MAVPPRLNVIPYPDHNYGQQPPLTPPATKITKAEEEGKKPLKTSIKSFSVEDKDAFEGATHCICGFCHDDGYMICCDSCSSWQHIQCMGIVSTQVPEKYMCHRCNPRELDIQKAKVIQSKKKEIMMDGDEEAEEEDESFSEEERPALYTAISNTPTRITLTAATNKKPSGHKKGKKVQKKKVGIYKK